MNKVQLDGLLRKVKRGEVADSLIKGMKQRSYIAIVVGNSEIEIKSKNHLNAIEKILTEIRDEGNQAFERAKLE